MTVLNEKIIEDINNIKSVKIERPYEFRQRLEQVHKPDRRKPDTSPGSGDIEIDSSWEIIIQGGCSKLIYNVARDLEDYFMISMGTAVRIGSVVDLEAHLVEKNRIILGSMSQIPGMSAGLDKPRSYRMIVEEKLVVICGYDDAGVGQGSYFIEDLMNLNEAPFLSLTNQVREPVFRNRGVHSGWGLFEYPDSQLNLIAHAGFTEINLFYTGPNSVPGYYGQQSSEFIYSNNRFIDYNDLVNRAADYGLEVGGISFLSCTGKTFLHPSDPEAEKQYDETYGKLFRECPGLKRIMLAGESCEFESKDTNSSGKAFSTKKEDIPPVKPGPGWWPCYDYPEFLELVKKVIKKYSPEAEIVFSTYNWGWAPEEARLSLIRNIPDEIVLQVTLDMPGYDINKAGLTCRVCDYSVVFPGPSEHFINEAQEAHKCGIDVYANAQSAGLTWDFGMIPYEPFPFQSIKRYRALVDAHYKWGVEGLYDTHHYGWWPSFVAELSKWAYWSPAVNLEEKVHSIACRDFGREAASRVLEAWRIWSSAIEYYVPADEDQYGPFRAGVAYPLFLDRYNPNPADYMTYRRDIPYAWNAFFAGPMICNTEYIPTIESRMNNYQHMRQEIESLQKMEELLWEGVGIFEGLDCKIPDNKKHNQEEMVRLGSFLARCTHTVINVKKWYIAKQEIFACKNMTELESHLSIIKALAENEIINSEAAIPLVEEDSRLGWEPSMEYICDAEHIRWKVRHLRHLINNSLPTLRLHLIEAYEKGWFMA